MSRLEREIDPTPAEEAPYREDYDTESLMERLRDAYRWIASDGRRREYSELLDELDRVLDGMHSRIIELTDAD